MSGHYPDSGERILSGKKQTVKTGKHRKETFTVDSGDMELVVSARHWDPFSVLGMHEATLHGKTGIALRVMAPGSRKVYVITDQFKLPLLKIHTAGFYEIFFPEKKDPFDYMLEIEDQTGNIRTIKDPYAFMPVLTDFDLYLFGEGTYYKMYEKFGAYMEHQGSRGMLFAVWAPNASSISVVGEMNWWDPRVHQMRNRGPTGVWELFIPDVPRGTPYKFRIISRINGIELYKADPHARYSQVRPQTASVTFDTSDYCWKDEEWMKTRHEKNNFSAPISIYEVHLGSWRKMQTETGERWLTYRELADQLVEHISEMGFTHVEFLPVMEHPFDGSWGYQVTGFHSPTSRFGNPDDFRYLIDRLHREGIGVILDWVPAHFPTDAHGIGFFDGTHLYEHEDPRLGFHKDWNTLIFNYGRREVAAFLISNALYWLDFFHIDGLRVDAVASMLYLDYSRNPGEWIPNKYGGRENLEAIDFIKTFNKIVYEEFPDIMTIAEESTAWPGVSRPVYTGGLGFGMKWNMGWMHDMLEYMSKDPIHRKYHHNNLTFSLLYAFTENFVLPLSHDEVVHGKGSLLYKMPGDEWQKFANLRLLFTYMFGHPGKKLLFMGGEFGQSSEWNHDIGLDWHLLEYTPHKSLMRFVRDLNRIYKTEQSMYRVDEKSDGFQWIDFRDSDNSIVSFVRFAPNREDHTVFIFNFTPVVRYDYRLGLPSSGTYKILINSDDSVFYGSGTGSFGKVESEPIPWQGFEHSAALQIPPLGAIVLKHL